MMIQKAGPKTEVQRSNLILEVENMVTNGEIIEKSQSECANSLGISRNTFRDYLNEVYKNLDYDVEAENKRIRNTRNYMLNSLLKDFNSTHNPLIKEKLSKTINSILESQEKTITLIIENKKEDVYKGSETFRTVFLDKIAQLPKAKVRVIDTPNSN